MANVFDNAVKGYTIGLNNKLNAQKAYIDSYITGINARNAVNQEARTKDQYWNYTNPLQKSNLGLTLAQQSLLTDMANDPTNRQYQKTITASDLGYRAGMGEQNMLNLPTDRNTSSNVALTNNTNSVFNKNASAFSLSTQDDLQKLEKDRIEQLKKAYPLMNEAQLLSLGAQIDSLKTPPTGTTNTDVPTTIMLPNGGTTPTGMFGTDGRFNFTGTTTTPASGLQSVNYSDGSWRRAKDASQGKTLPQQQYNPFSGLTMAQLQQKALELTGDPTAQSVRTGIGTNVRQYVPNFLLSADTIGADAGRIQAIDNIRQALVAEQNRLKREDENNRAARIEQARQSSYNQSIGAK